MEDIRVRTINGEKELWIYEDNRPLEELAGFGCVKNGMMGTCNNNCRHYGRDCDGSGYEETDVICFED